MRTCLLLFILLAASFSLYPATGKKGSKGEGKKERIVFERPLKKGEFFSCFARVDRSLEYLLALPGAAKPIERKDVLQLSLAGILEIREVNKKGQAAKITLHISSLSGSRNGREINSREWRGQKLLGDLAALPEPGSAQFSSSLKRPITKDELQLFRALFPGGGDPHSLSTFTSPQLTLEKGEKFPLELAPLLKTLAARKISGSREALSGEGVFSGRTRFRGIDAYKLRFQILSRKVPGYDLKYQAEILLPVDAAVGPSLQIYRNGREFIHKIVSSSNQFAAGGRLSQLITEETSITLLPESSPDLPGKPREKRGGFHELLRPRK